MASFKFLLRPSVKAEIPNHLFLRVIHKRKSRTATISCCLYSDEWDSEKQIIIFATNDPVRMEYLTRMQETLNIYKLKLKEIIKKLQEKVIFSSGEIITHFNRVVRDNGGLLGYAEMLAGELEDNKQYRTAQAYQTVSRGIVAFNNNTDIPITGINATLIKNFEIYLKEKGKQPNTVSYYMRNLRAIYNKGVAAKRIPQADEPPFANVFTGVEETKKRALITNEVRQLWGINFKKLLKRHRRGTKKYSQIQDLYHSWRLFFFSFYAQGMCFVDLAHLKKSHINGNIIRYYRKKTGGQIVVPINEEMRKIIESFEVETKNSAYIFPIIEKNKKPKDEAYLMAMRTQNRRLKKLAELAGIRKNITTHVARHSWATICKNELLPISVICEGLGHSSEIMTRKYLDSFDQSILGNAGRKVLLAISKPITQAENTISTNTL